MKLRSTFWVFGFLFVVAAVFLIGTGVSLIETPATMKLKKADQRRVRDLDHIDRTIMGYYKTNGHLPNSLGDLQETTSRKLTLTDPETNAEYPYGVLSDRRYEICAAFNLSNIGSGAGQGMFGMKEWQHKAGDECFEIEVEADKD